MRLLIAAITEGLEFDGGTIYKEALGGSETAFVMMMRELAKLGHEVHAFTKCSEPGVYDGVNYRRIQEFNELSAIFEYEVLFVYRHYGWLTRPNHAKLRILVNHDILVPENKSHFMGSLWSTDMLFNLSEYHKRQYCELLPKLDEHIWVTSNGIDLPAIDDAIKGVKKNKKRFVYGSRPERGLDVLLRDIWPVLYEHDPERELHIAGYGSKGIELPEEVKALYSHIDDLIEKTPGIVRAGQLKKDDWYHLLSSSSLYLYNTMFPEIHCIAATESQACGTPMITTDDFALKETVASDFCRIPGKNTSLEYQEEFIRRVEEMLSNDLFYRRVQMEGREHVEKSYPWERVAKSWEEKILSFFEERFQKNKHWVFKNLVYNSDVLTAGELARQEGMETELQEAEAILKRARSYKNEYACDNPDVLTTVSADFTKLGRVPVIAPYLKGVKTLLEIGCHYAEHSIGLSNLYPELKVLATDFSPDCIAQAEKFRETVAQHPENIELRLADWDNALQEGEYQPDAVFAGEILEHVEDPYAFIKRMERYVIPGGLVIFTLPAGPWEADSLRFPAEFQAGENRFHISDFRFRDIGELFSRKKDFVFSYCPNGITKRGELVGNWVMAYRADASPTGRIDLRRKFLTTRPYPGVSACLIVGNEEDNISRCLKSVRDYADEIIIVGTPACQDRTLEIAREFTDKIFVTSGDPPDRDPKIIEQCGSGDFGFWRNESIKPARYPWILWIDADEVLTGGQSMKKYLGEIFNGFVIRQHHLTIDIPPGNLAPDVPVRLFRNFKDYSFVGCVSGSTLIDCPRDLSKYPDGIPIRELEGVSAPWVYVCRVQEGRGRSFPWRRAQWVRKTQEHAPVMRLTWKSKEREVLGELIATPDHPVLLKEGQYTRMEELRPGMLLQAFNSRLSPPWWDHEVVSVEPWGHQDVYNMEVEGIHNFVANEVVVHNCLHEHAQESLNDPIDPAFQLEDVNIAHFGYITEAHRREKCYQRNLKLLMKDRLVNPDRTLGLVLLQRDYLNFVSLRLEETKGEFDEHIVKWLQSICVIHRQKFQDPADIYYKLSYALYQQALRWLGLANAPVNGCPTPPFEIGLWLGGSIGGLSLEPGSGVNPARRWFADVQEYRDHIQEMEEKLAGILRLQEL